METNQPKNNTECISNKKQWKTKFKRVLILNIFQGAFSKLVKHEKVGHFFNDSEIVETPTEARRIYQLEGTTEVSILFN